MEFHTLLYLAPLAWEYLLCCATSCPLASWPF